MKNYLGLLTAGELAKLHGLNKRTLHYYDEVGIFSPKIRGGNGYRYYSLEQTLELENVLYLRELGMSVEEIRTYMQNPNPADFAVLADSKLSEIDQKIAQLKNMKADFLNKKEKLLQCEKVYHGKIEVIHLPQRCFLLSELAISFENGDGSDGLIRNSTSTLKHLRKAWTLSNYHRNCGSYLSLDKVSRKDFKIYDGIFTEVDKKEKNLYARPEGRYLRGFCIGDWDRVPAVYEKILEFAEQNELTLSGYAFESGLNEFVIKSEEEYITQIEILCEAKMPK